MMNTMSNLREISELILEAHRPYGMNCKCGEDINSDAGWALHATEVLFAALKMRQEQQQLADGAGGISTNYKTGETTVYSKPCTRQSRWVTPWTTDSQGALTPPVAGDRPDEVVTAADNLRWRYYLTLGSKPLPWKRLTDAQKLPWLLKASREVSS